MKTHLFALFLLGTSIAGCAEERADRIDTITKLKILAVKAGHPDLLPGETTTVEVLVASPKTGAVSTALVPMARPGRDAGAAFSFTEGSTVPAAPVTTVVIKKATPHAAKLFYTAPRRPGSYDLAALVEDGEREAFSLAHALKALKAIRVREQGEALNENPEVSAVVMTRRWKVAADEDKVDLTVDGLRLEPEEVARLEARFTDETPDRASVVWWVTGGEFEDYGRRNADYIAPKKPGIVTVVALVLDRVNGSDWFIQDLAVGVDKLTPEVAGPNPLLVYSGGRLVWLALEPADRTELIARLGAGTHVTIAIEAVPDPNARLGWRAEKAVLSTGSGVTASEVSGARREQLLLSVDGIASLAEEK